MAIYHHTSNGERITQSTIDRRYSQALKDKHAGQTAFVCEGCGGRAVHNDHTISRARCKHLHKSELIYDPANFVSSCETCHKNWENWKSGEYLDAGNVAERMLYLKQNDPDEYSARINYNY